MGNIISIICPCLGRPAKIKIITEIITENNKYTCDDLVDEELEKCIRCKYLVKNSYYCCI